MISVKPLHTSANSKATTLVIPILKSNWDEVYTKLQSRFVLSETIKTAFKADKSETLVIYPNTITDINKIVLIGLGEKPSLMSFRNIIRLAFHQLKPKTKEAIQVELSGFESVEKEIEQLVINAFTGWMSIVSYKKSKEEDVKLTIDVLVPESYPLKEAKKNIKEAVLIAESKKMVMDLVNMPSNYLGPKEWARIAKKEADKRGISVTIMKEDELSKKGFGGIMAVGKGSSDQPRFIILEYKPEKYSKTVALIGKGVTFDTGGVSIKSSTNMHLMKCDMAGGANVMGAIQVAADLKLPVRVFALIPAVQNMLDGNAFVPGDIITAYNGLSIEVIDTDAEGRLILADALAYASKEIKPDVMIDLATLTGAIVTTLGYHAAGLFTTSDELAQSLENSGNSSGDKLWRLPMWDDYADALSADMADVKNYGGPPAGSIFAAKFVEKFTDSHPNWAHLDIAGMVMQNGPFAKDRVATGYGLELLVEYLKSI